MKTCTVCGMTKSDEEFYAIGPRTDGSLRRRADCRDCHKKRMRPRSAAHYANNKPYYRRRNDRRKKALYALVLAWKTVHNICTDCRQPHPPWRLDFDHLPGRGKTCEISTAYQRGWGVSRLEQEIAKCEIVCANCHRDRTHRRRLGVFSAPTDTPLAIPAGIR